MSSLSGFPLIRFPLGEIYSISAGREKVCFASSSGNDNIFLRIVLHPVALLALMAIKRRHILYWLLASYKSSFCASTLIKCLTRDIMFPGTAIEPFYCGFCHHGKLTKPDTSSACGAQVPLRMPGETLKDPRSILPPSAQKGNPDLQCSYYRLKREERNRTILSMHTYSCVKRLG
ncbi:hypothetical protein AVEN_147547-1 [Araneus ventricosus]|uniref:Uncharacterized protein n=1 Tax=Araneus ventricosus TaxID=182803 RepID=A0A4Y2VBT2_ARAVE|nr:hypothetical protein AVEN_147547-1 [Araneus ventricosus]